LNLPADQKLNESRNTGSSSGSAEVKP
jgi:hypothetical protein